MAYETTPVELQGLEAKGAPKHGCCLFDFCVFSYFLIFWAVEI